MCLVGKWIAGRAATSSQNSWMHPRKFVVRVRLLMQVQQREILNNSLADICCQCEWRFVPDGVRTVCHSSDRPCLAAWQLELALRCLNLRDTLEGSFFAAPIPQVSFHWISFLTEKHSKRTTCVLLIIYSWTYKNSSNTIDKFNTYSWRFVRENENLATARWNPPAFAEESQIFKLFEHSCMGS